MSLNARGNTDPGQFDRRVQLLAPSRTRDAAGGSVAAFTQYAEVWAAKLPAGSGARLYAASAKHAEVVVTYRIRHRTDVLAYHQLTDGGATYEILQPEEEGRSHHLLLPCRAIDQNTAAKRTTAALRA